MSEDWIPVPEIENVLIVLARLAEDPDEILKAPVMTLLEELKSWTGGAVYVFHDPPEAGEVLEDVDPDMAARFALAAQMSDIQVEVCRDAFRRVFSRASVQRVVLVSNAEGDIPAAKLEEIFESLKTADVVWAGEWPWRFALGMRQFQGEIFSDADTGEVDLRKAVERTVAADALTYQIVDNI